jgi:hypothetical protein
MAFMRADLASVDRAKTPWVMVSAHFPFYETYDDDNAHNRARRAAAKDGGARGNEEVRWRGGGAQGGDGTLNDGSESGGEENKVVEAEAEADGAHRPEASPTQAVTPSKAQALLDFEPMLAEFGVGMFFAGHDHNYETTWPVYGARFRTEF